MTYVAPPGNYTIKDKVLETEFDGQKTEYTLKQVRLVLLIQPSVCRFKGILERLGFCFHFS